MDPALEDEGETIPILQSTSSTVSSFHDSGLKTRSGGEGAAIKVYKWRWVVLLVFVANLSINNGIWISFSPIADVAQCYYNTTKFWVNSVSMVYMLTYILFIVPSAWLLGRVGLRTTLVIASCMNSAGACLRVAGAGAESNKQTNTVGVLACPSKFVRVVDVYFCLPVKFVPIDGEFCRSDCW